MGGSGERFRNNLLCCYLWVICYRFRELLVRESSQSELRLPRRYCGTDSRAFQEKARASITSCGVFLGFSIAVLAAIVGSELSQKVFNEVRMGSKSLIVFGALLGVLISFFVVWVERWISACSVEAERRGQSKDQCRRKRSRWLLALFSGGIIFFSGGLGWFFPVLKPLFSQGALVLAGLGLVILSIFFLYLAIEYYDSASGWRGRRDNIFHFAAMGSASGTVGFSAGLIGVSLLVAILSVKFARVATVIALFMTVAMTEIERRVNDLTN